MTYPLPTNFTSGSTVTATNLNNISSLVNTLWVLVAGVPALPTAHAATTGSETFTITSGAVATINGTSIDGVSVATNDYVLVKDAPATTGTGSVLSTQPANGLYQVTGVATNISLTRATQMSASGGAVTPAGMFVVVMAGTVNGGLGWNVSSPNSESAFTYGTTAVAWTQLTAPPTVAQTFQNKRITKRIGSVGTGTTISIDTDNYDIFQVTALASGITGYTITGTPNHGDRLELEITDNGSTQALGGWSWITPCGAVSLPGFTTPGKKMTFSLKYDSTYTTWVCLAVDVKGYA
jgi:hypothetical protein